MADIQINAIITAAFHFVVDGTGHDVAWGQFATRIKLWHKAGAIGEQQPATFPAYGLGDQEGFGLGVIQAGRMELVEFQVGDPATGAPGHGDAITGGGIGVTGIQINFAGTPGSEHDLRCPKDVYLVGVPIEDIGAQATLDGMPQFAGSDQIDCDMMFVDRDIGMLPNFLFQGGFNRLAGGIGGMNDPPV